MKDMTLWIVTPCYFDVKSLSELAKRIKETMESSLGELDYRLVVVDDTAGQDAAVAELISESGNLECLTPPYNLGHQGALVFGLRSLAARVTDSDLIVTLDCDGEDRPEDIPRLLSPLLANSDNLSKVVLARRTRRQETSTFKLMYFFFKIFFRLLTGTLVQTGNFAAFRGWLARHVLFHPFFDFCYSSSFLSLNLEYELVPLERASRYFGQSKMNTMSLITHGFRMLLPFSEKISVRAIIICGALFFLSVIIALAGFVFARDSIYVVTITCLVCAYLFLSALISMGAFVVTFITYNQSMALGLRTLTTDADKDD